MVMPPVEQPEEDDGDLSDVLTATKEDMMGDTEEGIDDLTNVTDEDIFGEGGEDMSDLVDVDLNSEQETEEMDIKKVKPFDYTSPPARLRPRLRIVQPWRPPLPPNQSVGGLQQ